MRATYFGQGTILYLRMDIEIFNWLSLVQDLERSNDGLARQFPFLKLEGGEAETYHGFLPGLGIGSFSS
jgi:hypothetical protein